MPSKNRLDRYSCALLCLALSFACSRSFARPNDDLEAANVHWHNAGIAEIRHDNNLAREEYSEVIEAVQHCPSEIREWFIGTAELAIARCEARSQNSEATRLAVLSALEHHFWNFELIRADPLISPIVGASWLDSTLTRWKKIRSTEVEQWHPQRPIVIGPDSVNGSGSLPLVLALHGGNANYAQFADQWRNIANKEHIRVAIPSGPDRISDVANSWSTSFEVNDDLVRGVIDSLVALHLADNDHIFVAGYSQGAEQALEMVLVHPDRVRGALLLSGFIQKPVPDDLLDGASAHHSVVCALSGEYEAPTLYDSLLSLSNRARKHGMTFELQHVPGMMHEVPLDLDSRFHDLWLLLNGTPRTCTGAIQGSKNH